MSAALRAYPINNRRDDPVGAFFRHGLDGAHNVALLRLSDEPIPINAARSARDCMCRLTCHRNVPLSSAPGWFASEFVLPAATSLLRVLATEVPSKALSRIANTCLKQAGAA